LKRFLVHPWDGTGENQQPATLFGAVSQKSVGLCVKIMIVGQLPFAKVSSENQRKAFVRGQCLRNFVCVRHAECDCHLSIIAGGSPFSPQMADSLGGN